MAGRKVMSRSQIRSCVGSAAAVLLADDLAADPSSELASEVRRRLVVVDGCASACARRTLEARGQEVVGVTLDELGIEPDETVRGRARAALRARALDRLTELAAATPAARPRRRTPRPGVQGTPKPAHSGDDYLLAIHLLTSPVASCGTVVEDVPTVAAHVADALSVTRMTAGEMLRRLEKTGLVARGPAKQILLTRAGRETATTLLRRHRLVERFLVDVLDYTPAESYRLALVIGDGFPELVTDRLEALAGSARCPHGWHVDPSRDAEFAAGLVALTTLPAGATTTVSALVEHDADMLERLLDLGFEPGVTLSVAEVGDDSVAVDVAGERRVLASDEASTILVPRDTASS